MKKVLLPIVALAIAGFAMESSAATTASINVTVSLGEVVSVQLDSSTWAIGAINLGGSDASPTFTATNNGNVPIDLDIKGTNAAGGWTLAASEGADAFAVDVSNPSISLSTSDQTLASNVAIGNTKAIGLTYNAPTSDTFGGGVNQGFSITVTASKHVP